MKQAAIILGLLLVASAAIAFWQRSRWIGEMNEQCEAAMPLVRGHATRETVIRQLGKGTVEYSSGDWPVIRRNFGASDGETTKTRDAKQWLGQHGRLVVYSRSNSVMFVYFDGEDKALQASCFLQ